MRSFTKAIAIVLCLCLCTSLSACRSETSGSSVDDSYLEGMEQAKEDFFLALWKAAYDLKAFDCGELWETDDFSLRITTLRKTEVSYDENAPYIEIDFTINESTIERQWKSGNLRFYIYSVSNNGMDEVGNANYWFDYFDLGGSLQGNSGKTDVMRIYEETEFLRVLIVINDRIYATSYSVQI